VLRQYTDAPAFHARMAPEWWVQAATGEQVRIGELPFSRVAAFCGLGNPESFWHTLDLMDIHPVDRVTFDDHHAYRPREIRHMAHGFLNAKAEAVVTTEKDVINLCDGWAGLMAPLPVYWLKIRTEIDREAEFLELIERRIASTQPRNTARHA